jgi:hypothetical protein
MPWQRLYSERCDCKYQNAWTVTEYCSLFIGTGRSLRGITSMPLIKTYNIDSDLYGLKGHSTFKSVCNAEALWKRTFGHLVQTTSVENCFSLEDLRRRSIDPTRNVPCLWFALLVYLAHKGSKHFCRASNHQKNYRNGPRAHFPSNLPLFGDLFQHIKKQQEECNINSNWIPNTFNLGFGIFRSLFATTWFVFANQIHFPISKSNTLVWAHREIFQE